MERPSIQGRAEQGLSAHERRWPDTRTVIIEDAPSIIPADPPEDPPTTDTPEETPNEHSTPTTAPVEQ